MRTSSVNYDIIDIDPYGTFEPFLNSALESCNLHKPTLLCLTSTDVRVLCNPHLIECFRRYGTFFPKTPFMKEVGIRILLNCLNSRSIPKKMHVIFDMQT